MVLTRVSIIGVGKVGSTTAFKLLAIPKIDELLLVDIKEDLLEGEYLDLLHASTGMKSNVKLKYSKNVEDVKGSDLIIITAGVPRDPIIKSRLDLAEINGKIIKDICKKIKKTGDNPMILLTTNPVDLMTYVALKILGYDKGRVFGMGSKLDSFRFKTSYPKAKMTLGEHGDSMVFVPHNAPDKAKEYTKKISKKIIELKGGTWWGPSIALYNIVDSIINDKKGEKIISTYLNGEYGLNNVCLSIPVKLGVNGIEEIVESDLSEKELELLKKSADVLKKAIKTIGF